jgi:endonuclease/exonuclease/phosphatase family metal-dependent hydrolase
MIRWLLALILMGYTGMLAQAQTIKVMTYNIHHANPPSREKEGTIDLPAVAAVINAAHPDLVALQEIDANNARAGVDTNEAKELGRLTGMNFFFSRAIWFQGGAYGDAVLSRYPIRDTMRYELPIEPGTKAETRVLCIIKVQLPDGKQLLFGSTHLDQHGNETNRMLQAKTIEGIVRGFTLPCIIGGDFNAGPDSRPLMLLDSVLARSCRTDCPLTIPTEHPVKTIDYILYAPAARFTVLGVRSIPETYASDHLPVLADIQIKKRLN